MAVLGTFLVLFLVLIMVWVGLIFALVVGAARVVLSPIGIAASIFICAVWVYQDAKKLHAHGGFTSEDRSPAAWFLCCMVIWFVYFPIYLYQRRKYTTRACENDPQFAAIHREEDRLHVQQLAGLLYAAASLAVLFGIFLLVLHFMGPIRISPFI